MTAVSVCLLQPAPGDQAMGLPARDAAALPQDARLPGHLRGPDCGGVGLGLLHPAGLPPPRAPEAARE